MQNVPYRCPACSGCKQCPHGARLGLSSSLSFQEQQDIQSIINFKDPFPTQPGYYISRLPLLPDYQHHMFSNYDAVNEANIKLLQQLKKRDSGDAAEISRSYNELLENKFITPLEDLPQDQQSYILNNRI